MKIGFRVDASLIIGTGHVMRCLTLADALRANGAECIFLSREHAGNLHETILGRGYPVLNLGKGVSTSNRKSTNSYSDWLGVDTGQDAEDTRAKVAGMVLDWLIVDHYSLDAGWEREAKFFCRWLMAIDDLANRDHAVDMLLDQNFGKTSAAYANRVPESCVVMVGTQYALLRPEFLAMRTESLRRRGHGVMKSILVTMGGVDLDNATGKVLNALQHWQSSAEFAVTVIMGASAPWKNKIIDQVCDLPFQVNVQVNPKNMAVLMRDADLAIGAAGSTSWERCCLGLPTVQLILAENQRPIADALNHAGAAYVLEPDQVAIQLGNVMNQFVQSPELLSRLSLTASQIVDGYGCERVVKHLKERMAT